MEVSEKPTEALVRELQEELDIVASVHSTNPAVVAQEQAEDGTRPIVLELYIVDDWKGDPQAMEGGAIGWFAPEKASQLDLAPLDIELAEKLFANLPR